MVHKMNADEAKKKLEIYSSSWRKLKNWSLSHFKGPVDENGSEFFFEACYHNSLTGEWSFTPYGVDKITGEIQNRTEDE